MSLRRAILWSLFWVGCSLAFAGFLATWRGPGAAQLFLAGYAVEKALSIDNLLVFVGIFAYFRIPPAAQPRILYLGFIGAALFRFIFLASGTVLMNLHPSVGVLFGALVMATAVQMLRGGDEDSETDYEAKWFVKLAQRVSTTPAFICLVAIEVSDIIFAFDSMPAVIAITRDPFIVYAAVMFAVLGLRSMYFVLAALMSMLTRLTISVVAILFFIGAKIITKSLADWLSFPPLAAFDLGPTGTLLIVFGCLAGGVVASVLWPDSKTESV